MILESTQPAPQSTAEGEALAAFRTLGELSVEAAVAVEAGDSEAVLRILAERARIMERVDDLIVRVMTDPGSRARTAASGAPTSLVQAARQLSILDASLRNAVATHRDSLSRDLNALESGGAARSAYGGRLRGPDTINVMR